jgi:branched-chain amino acid transport system ATP-binding protein
VDSKEVRIMTLRMLETNGVTVRFGGLLAVNSVNCYVDKGEIVGLIGPNGAGKTTFFNAISGFRSPDAGEVSFKGTSIIGLRPHKISRMGMSRTFQIVKPFPEMSVVENVMIGAFSVHRATREARAAAMRALELVKFESWAHRRAGDLPVAGRKRLEVAKVMACEPEMILLDEVMAGLTPSEHNEMIDAVRNIQSSGVTIVIIEHVMPVIMSLCDRIYVLHHGELICEGAPEKVIRDPDVVRAYLGEDFAL